MTNAIAITSLVSSTVPRFTSRPVPARVTGPGKASEAAGPMTRSAPSVESAAIDNDPPANRNCVARLQTAVVEVAQNLRPELHAFAERQRIGVRREFVGAA